MRIRNGTVKEDVTAFGNRFWIQIEDTATVDHRDLKELVGKRVSVVFGEVVGPHIDSTPLTDDEKKLVNELIKDDL